MNKDNLLSRRNFIRGAALATASIPLASLLSACGASDQSASSSTASSSATSSASTAASDASTTEAVSSTSASSASSGKVFVAYFSGTGNTRRAAEGIASELGAGLFEIEPANPYTDADLDWTDDSSRVLREHENESEQDIELKTTTPDGFDGYDTVFFGYPIWWQDAAWPVRHFASDNDFSGKTVIPFCTSTSSPIGESGENLAKMAGTGDWQEGTRFSSGVTADEAAGWAKSFI